MTHTDSARRTPRAHPSEQPFAYPLQREWAEPDWTRLPGWRDVTRQEWESAQWQRAHTVKNLRQLLAVFGELFPADLLASVEHDQAERATMSMLIPPQMLNTMNERDLWRDPVRRYMLPAFDDRDGEWPGHPLATRDSLHEADMWAVEGLTHRYPTNVLAGLERLARKARERDVDLALHVHVNHANSLTPLVAKAVRALLEMGFRDVRNQGVLLRGVNATASDLLELCFTLLDRAKVMPYYFYMCDMIPNSEHWRISVADAQALQHAIMGYLPGFATPRVVCDVPFVGKRWVHQTESYDREKGISYWTKSYRTGIEFDDPDVINRLYKYYEPIHTLPEPGKEYWRRFRIQHSSPSQTG